MSHLENTNNREIKTTTQAIDKSSTHKIIIFWTITVIANSLLGAFTYINASRGDYLGIFGVVTAIVTCIAIYSIAEIYLRQRNHNQLAFELRLSACIRIFLQPFSDFAVGLLAVALTRHAFKIITPLLYSNSEPFHQELPVGFFSTYITTMVHAFIASILVCCILAMVKLSIYAYRTITQP